MFPWQQRKANANVASDFVEEADVKTFFNSTGVFWLAKWRNISKTDGFICEFHLFLFGSEQNLSVLISIRGKNLRFEGLSWPVLSQMEPSLECVI